MSKIFKKIDGKNSLDESLNYYQQKGDKFLKQNQSPPTPPSETPIPLYDPLPKDECLTIGGEIERRHTMSKGNNVTTRWSDAFDELLWHYEQKERELQVANAEVAELKQYKQSVTPITNGDIRMVRDQALKIQELEQQLAMANDAAAKGEKGRELGTAYEEATKRIAELEGALEAIGGKCEHPDKEPCTICHIVDKALYTDKPAK